MRQWQHERAAVDPALVAALHHISAPAFVVTSFGRVVAANQPGRVWLASQPGGDHALSRPAGPDPSHFEVTPSGRAGARYSLAVLRIDTRVAEPVCPPVQWSLTPREHEVVALLARGASNHQIATELDCSPRTVEHHVSNVLRKANVDSRSALIVAMIAR